MRSIRPLRLLTPFFLTALAAISLVQCATTTPPSKEKDTGKAPASTTIEGTIAEMPMAHMLQLIPGHRHIYLETQQYGQMVVYVKNAVRCQHSKELASPGTTMRFRGELTTVSGRGKGGQERHQETQLIATSWECL